MADNASFVIRGRRRTNSARPVFRYAKAHWLPPVNRALAWSEGVLTVDVYAVAHCNRRVDVSASCDGRRLHIRGGSISTESAAFACQFDVRFAQKVPAFAFGGSRLAVSAARGSDRRRDGDQKRAPAKCRGQFNAACCFGGEQTEQPRVLAELSIAVPNIC